MNENTWKVSRKYKSNQFFHQSQIFHTLIHTRIVPFYNLNNNKNAFLRLRKIDWVVFFSFVA